MSKLSRILALSLLFSTGALTAAHAGTSTANMNVTITITSGCTFSVTNIGFGNQTATSLSTALTSTAAMGGLLTYTCSPGSSPTLSASNGQNYTTTNRMKGSTTDFIPYSLNVPTLPMGTGTAQTVQITATIPAQGSLPAVDSYSDAVVLTLTY
jgi:spore coat protein U-like protein